MHSVIPVGVRNTVLAAVSNRFALYVPRFTGEQREGVIAMERGEERKADANDEKDDGGAELVPEEEMETLGQGDKLQDAVDRVTGQDEEEAGQPRSEPPSQ
jgi:hypothetical protein